MATTRVTALCALVLSSLLLTGGHWVRNWPSPRRRRAADALTGVGGYEFTVMIDPSHGELVDVRHGDAVGPRALWLEPVTSGCEVRAASVGPGPAESSGASTLARVCAR